jgi:hypothetical protein
MSDLRLSQVAVEALADPSASEARVSQVVVEAITWETIPTRVSQVAVEVIFNSPEPSFQDGTVINPLGFLELTLEDDTEKAFAEVDLNDNVAYHMGYKSPWILSFKSISRGISDKIGQMEHMTFGAILSDVARYFRGVLENTLTKHLVNRPMAEWVVNDDDRRLERPARLAANGFVTGYSPRPDLQFEITGGDWLKKKFSRKARASQSWQPLITSADFPACPTGTVGNACPLIFGVVSDEGETPSTGAVQAVTFGGVPGGYFPHGLGLDTPEMGTDDPVSLPALATAYRSWGVLPGNAPTAMTATATTGGHLHGNFRGGDENKCGFVTAVFAGVETDPSPMAYDAVGPVSGTNAITFGWTLPAGPAPDAIRLYVTNQPYAVSFKFSKFGSPSQPFIVGSDYVRLIELSGAATSYTFLEEGWNGPAAGTEATFERVYVYRIRAVLAGNVRSAASGEILAMSHPYRRPVHLRWLPFPDAIGYEIQRRTYSGIDTTDYDTLFSVGPTGATGVQTIDGVSQLEYFDDLVTAGDVEGVSETAQPPRGAYRPIAVGVEEIAGVIWWQFLICQGAIADVIGVYVNGVRVPDSEFGVRMLCPHKPGYPGGVEYRVINNTRYSILYVDGPYGNNHVNGDQQITMNVKGYEAIGDGTGAVVKSLVAQRKLFMLNFLAPDTPVGDANWATTSPVFAHLPTVPLVDVGTYHGAEARLATRMGNGLPYEGGVVIGAGGELVGALDALAWFSVSADVDSYFNHRGSECLTTEPVFISEVASLAPVNDVVNIVDGSFTIEDDSIGDFFNILPFVHTKDYSGRSGSEWRFEGEARSEASIVAYDQERASNRWDLYACRADTIQGALTVTDVMARKRARYQDPRRTVTFSVPLSGMSYEVGDVLPLTHVEGIGADGWEGHFVRVLRHELMISGGRTLLTCYDLGTGLNLGGYWSTDGAADWTAASDAERALWLWWAPDADEVYSDGYPVRLWS